MIFETLQINSPRTEQFQFSFDGNVLAGEIAYPKCESPRALVILLQGSGSADRYNNGYFLPVKKFLLQEGFALMCYDKPGTGSSSGSWERQTFAARAQECIAAIEHLKNKHQLSNLSVGLWGHSQGGWIEFIVACAHGDISFMIVNSGCVVSPAEQDRFGIEHLNRELGVGESEILCGLQLYDQVIEAAGEDVSFETLNALLRSKQSLAWDNYFQMTDEKWLFFKQNYNHDPLQFLVDTHCPVLFLYGSEDSLVPVNRCVTIINKLISSGQINLQVEIFDAANHRIQIGERLELAPDYFKIVNGWLRKLTIL